MLPCALWFGGREKGATGDGTGGGEDAGIGDEDDGWRCNARSGLLLGGAAVDGVDRRAADMAVDAGRPAEAVAEAEWGVPEMRRASRVRKTSSASGGAAGAGGAVVEEVGGSGVVVRPPWRSGHTGGMEGVDDTMSGGEGAHAKWDGGGRAA